jgi:hypothetical protein
MVRWVGFDMDECIGSVMPIYPFVTKLPKAYAAATGKSGSDVYEAMTNALYMSEITKNTWVLRPAFYDALSVLYRAFKTGKIYGAFIFSNNGSQELVDFLVHYSNACMARKFNDLDRPAIFKMGACRDSPLRSPGSLIKSYAEIQGALAKKGLPLMSSGRDLLFFDDMVHVLTGEIRDYVQVRPYLNLCPLERVVAALSGLEKLVGSTVWEAVVRLARHYAAEDKDPHYLKTPPTVKETINDTLMFHQGLKRFLGQRAGAFGKRTRKIRSARKSTLRRPLIKKYL